MDVRRHGPPSGSMVSNAELAAAIDAHFGPGVTTVERALSRYATSATVEHVRVHTTEGSVAELILKDLSPAAMLADARSFKPAFLLDPARELMAYQHLLPHVGALAATCIAAVADGPRRWLLLEKVPGVEMYQVGEVEVWAAAAAATAHLHTALAGALRTAPDEVAGGLLRQDAAYLRHWMERALAYEKGRGGRRSAEMMAVARVHDDVVDELSALPVAVLHGDLYASNVLVVRTSLRVCPVDWEMVSSGPAVLDLAALTSGAWSDEDRQTMTTAYWSAMQDPRWPDLEAFQRAVDLARLQVCVQWLGWSAGWTPPAEHAHDWLAEAGLLVRRLWKPQRR